MSSEVSRLPAILGSGLLFRDLGVNTLKEFKDLIDKKIKNMDDYQSNISSVKVEDLKNPQLNRDKDLLDKWKKLKTKKDQISFCGALILRETISKILFDIDVIHQTNLDSTKYTIFKTNLDSTLDILFGTKTTKTLGSIFDNFDTLQGEQDESDTGYSRPLGKVYSVSHGEWRQKLDPADNARQCFRGMDLQGWQTKLNPTTILQSQGNTGCWLCGMCILPPGVTKDDPPMTMECEHVIGVQNMVELFDIIRTDKQFNNTLNGSDGTFAKNLWRILYDMSHACCNREKKSMTFWTFDTANGKYKVCEKNINIFLKKIQQKIKTVAHSGDCQHILKSHKKKIKDFNDVPSGYSESGFKTEYKWYKYDVWKLDLSDSVQQALWKTQQAINISRRIQPIVDMLNNMIKSFVSSRNSNSNLANAYLNTKRALSLSLGMQTDKLVHNLLNTTVIVSSESLKKQQDEAKKLVKKKVFRTKRTHRIDNGYCQKNYKDGCRATWF